MLTRWLLIFGFLLSCFVPQIQAQEAPVVYAVLFYSPTCPHCHKVINEDLPVMQEEFGDQFQVIPINVTVEAGAQLFYAACAAFDRDGRCGGVPMMLIGETLLFGSAEIPDLAPGIIRAGLAAGGIPVADFSIMREVFEQWQLANTPSESNSGIESTAPSVRIEQATVWDRLSADPEANLIASAVLLALIASVAATTWLGWRGILDGRSQVVRGAALAAGTACFLIGFTIVAKRTDDNLATLISWAVLSLVVVGMVFIGDPDTRLAWGLPFIVLAGIGVAIYLSHVEMSETTATCGAIGDCNTVQQSDYARLLGVLPVGVLGLAGYMAILLAWSFARLPAVKPQHKQIAHAALLGLTLFGAIFSIYLTFLEPFVIGASCAWCLMSALTMLLLLWLVAPAGWAAVRPMFRQEDA